MRTKVKRVGLMYFAPEMGETCRFNAFGLFVVGLLCLIIENTLPHRGESMEMNVDNLSKLHDDFSEHSSRNSLRQEILIKP